MNRRTFLKLAGMGSIAFAAGCSPSSENGAAEKRLFALVDAPDDMVTGRAVWYASTCRECPAGCGLLAKNREGRVVKLEGNPLHPVNRGKLCVRGQAGLQAIYNPDRLTQPQIKTKEGWLPITFRQATSLLENKTADAVRSGRHKVKMLTETVGETMWELMNRVQQHWHGTPPMVYETYAYDTLKAANKVVWGEALLPDYHIDQADCLVGFGAEFLETWLSPVAFARRFKKMHAYRDEGKSVFIQVSPNQSLTGANADKWLGCNPGAETIFVLGLIKQALAAGRGRELPKPLTESLAIASRPFGAGAVAAGTGVSADDFNQVAVKLLAARNPLVLGASQAAVNGYQTDLAVLLLNLLLKSQLPLIDFKHRHRVEMAARGERIAAFFSSLAKDAARVLLLNNVNPVFGSPAADISASLQRENLYVVSFSNFMDETSQLADLIFPVSLGLESWDDYAGRGQATGTLQPAMGALSPAPQLGSVLLQLTEGGTNEATDYQSFLYSGWHQSGRVQNQRDWLSALSQGGFFEAPADEKNPPNLKWTPELEAAVAQLPQVAAVDNALLVPPSIRFLDGRGANRPWLNEIPDPVTQVTWKTPVLAHPETLSPLFAKTGDVVRLTTPQGSVKAPVYATRGIRPGQWVMPAGQGHTAYGRYAADSGDNPFELLPPPGTTADRFAVADVRVERTSAHTKLAHIDGHRFQLNRKIALTVDLKPAMKAAGHPDKHAKHGLTMNDFPLTLPLPEGYDPKRDIYPSHDHENYRWGMVVDLDRCVGCGACVAACYAENNIGLAGERQILNGREMAWLQIQRYHDPEDETKIVFLPMMCQHCDNAPCEAVCPVYAPHHSKEGLNNQVYNRCIGTRFCAQNCPYKVRRFNWFSWEWPEPLNLQLNPDVTVRSKGVMEKCSFCIQRIKRAHNEAKNEKRMIHDGDVVPACMQTCPTDAFTFGNLMDKKSRVRQLVDDSRAYQVMGYLNTKPAVIYLKKVTQTV